MSRVTDARYRALMDADAQRSALGLTYEDIAKVGVAERSVGSWLRGESWPQGPNRAKLEHAIGWPDGELVRRERRHSQMPRRAMRWATDAVYRYRIANRILRAGVQPDDRPGGVDSEHVEAVLDADSTVAFDDVEAILRGVGIDVAELDSDGSR